MLNKYILLMDSIHKDVKRHVPREGSCSIWTFFNEWNDVIEPPVLLKRWKKNIVCTTNSN